jgi:hypothetical protein
MAARAATSLWPRRERPQRRAILVEAPVSSTNTSRPGSSITWLFFQSMRAAATSSRSCSAACAVFFKTHSMPLEEPPHRGRADAEPAIAKRVTHLHQGYVRRRRYRVQDPSGIGFNPVRAVVAALLVRRHRARAPIALMKLGNKTRAHAKSRRDGPDRRTADADQANTEQPWQTSKSISALRESHIH